MKATVNSIDVAKLAGVSQSAVSRVFTPGASVSAAMRSRVIEAAAKLGYYPNRLAGSLITQRSYLIGIAFAYLGSYFYSLVLEGLSRRLRAAGYQTLMFFTEGSELDEDVVHDLLQYRVDGVILGSISLSSPSVEACERAGVPVVLFSRMQDDPHVSGVTAENVEAATTVANFLIRGGHRRIAYLGGLEASSVQRDRETGFRRGLAAAGMALFDRAIGDFLTEPAKRAARQLFDRPPGERPDAVFVCSDQMALAAMDVIRFELGLRIPEDVSVVGFDDVPQASALSYQLTTMRQPVDCMIEAAVEMMIARIERPNAPAMRPRPSCSLVVRQSARIPVGWAG